MMGSIMVCCSRIPINISLIQLDIIPKLILEEKALKIITFTIGKVTKGKTG